MTKIGTNVHSNAPGVCGKIATNMMARAKPMNVPIMRCKDFCHVTPTFFADKISTVKIGQNVELSRSNRAINSASADAVTILATDRHRPGFTVSMSSTTLRAGTTRVEFVECDAIIR